MTKFRIYRLIFLIIVSAMTTSSCTVFRHKQKMGRGVIIESRPAGRFEPGPYDQVSDSGFAPDSAKKKKKSSFKKKKKRKRR